MVVNLSDNENEAPGPQFMALWGEDLGKVVAVIVVTFLSSLLTACFV